MSVDTLHCSSEVGAPQESVCGLREDSSGGTLRDERGQSSIAAQRHTDERTAVIPQPRVMAVCSEVVRLARFSGEIWRKTASCASSFTRNWPTASAEIGGQQSASAAG